MGASTNATPAETHGNADGKDDTYAAVVRIIDAATGLQENELVREARIEEDLNIDSLSLLDIAVRLEEKFGVQISQQELYDAATVGGIVDLIAEHE